MVFTFSTSLLSTGIRPVGHLIHEPLEIGQPLPMLLLEINDIHFFIYERTRWTASTRGSGKTLGCQLKEFIKVMGRRGENDS